MYKGLMVVVALGTFSLMGCEEKKEAPAPAPVAAPAPVKPPEPPKPQLKAGKELADQYAACTKRIEAGEFDAF
jgi:hypothetical protein